MFDFRGKPHAAEALKGKKVAVVGAGVEGLSSAKWLKERGAEVTVLDQSQKKRLRDKEIKILVGKNYLDNLDQYDLIVRSPGVRLKTIEQVLPETSKYKITSQTKLFFEGCPCPIIGVTGTKGKGTTVSLIYQMLKKQEDGLPAGRQVYLGGNIGVPPLDFLDNLSKNSIVVLELSSFQLQDLTKSPHIAVLLMTTVEHLDYHEDEREYVEAKRNLLRFQAASDAAVINKDYPVSREADVTTEGQVFWVSREEEVEQGCYVKDGKVIVRIARGPAASSSHPTSSKKSSASPAEFLRALDGTPSGRVTPRPITASPEPRSFRAGGEGEVRFQDFADINSEAVESLRLGKPRTFSPRKLIEVEIIDVKDILLPGAHNLENVCAAVMAAVLAGVSKKNIVSVLKTFKGLPHRLELVEEFGGVRYYNDSFSTTPETAIAAIQSFRNPEILILGGSSKNSDFSELGRVISSSRNIKVIIGVGVEWPRIKEEILSQVQDDNILMLEGLKDMRSIVQKASELASKGDIVLLSPACASFGMFKDYKDRGEQFKHYVLELNSKFPPKADQPLSGKIQNSSPIQSDSK